jgi:hypothetical protein
MLAPPYKTLNIMLGTARGTWTMTAGESGQRPGRAIEDKNLQALEQAWAAELTRGQRR